MPSIFRTCTPLAASAETMFAFHADPHNLKEVMPPTLRLVNLNTDGTAQEGRLIELYCRDWWIIPMRWTCRCRPFLGLSGADETMILRIGEAWLEAE